MLIVTPREAPGVTWPVITPTTVSFHITPPEDDGGLAPTGYELKYFKSNEEMYDDAKTHVFPAGAYTYFHSSLIVMMI